MPFEAGAAPLAATLTADRIADYAMIGDCRSAALISRSGELAWLCWPHFSSPSVFGALLDGDGGSWRIDAGTPLPGVRRYWPNTNILETSLQGANGILRLVDTMPLPLTSGLHPLREVLRRVEAAQGTIRARMRIDPRAGYGESRMRLERRGPRLWAWSWGSEALLLQTDFELHPVAESATALEGEVVLRAGERRDASLTYVASDIGAFAGLGDAADERLAATAAWWASWVTRMRYAGPHHEAVARSALLLKLLCCAQSGAVVAAPTTSLPEWPGADRNWDYRYCWLRDAALTMRALVGLGFLDESRAFLDWLLHATRLTWPELRVLYDVYGRCDVDERTLPHWRGFRDSRPVRVGNAAMSQHQLDVYGAVCFAARAFVDATGELHGDEARLLRGIGAEILRRWSAPDHGIWEVRGPRRHYTYSKMMAALGLESLEHLAVRGHGARVRGSKEGAGAIRAAIAQHGFNVQLGSYVGTFGGHDLEASVLLAGCLGYEHPRAARMAGTLRCLDARLSKNGLLYRYAPGYDGFDSPEGAFTICSLAAVDHLAQQGQQHAALARFERVLGLANDVGLLAEEADPDTGELLGNFPQAYTHVGVITAALALESS